MLKTLLKETGSASLHDCLRHHHKWSLADWREPSPIFNSALQDGSACTGMPVCGACRFDLAFR
jgi:hypothetical protein